MVPEFGPDGNLPPNIHQAEWSEFAERFGGTAHRRGLLRGLERASWALRAAGCRRVYIDGSFTTAKEVPDDFDACWDVTGVDPARLDPVLLCFDNRRAAQKAKYVGELFPAQIPADAGGTPFLQFFQVDKETGGTPRS